MRILEHFRKSRESGNAAPIVKAVLSCTRKILAVTHQAWVEALKGDVDEGLEAPVVVRQDTLIVIVVVVLLEVDCPGAKMTMEDPTGFHHLVEAVVWMRVDHLVVVSVLQLDFDL